jgi:hypothetical protein
MGTVEVRLDLRLPQELYDFLQEESRLKKLSFEGLFLAYLRERLRQERGAQGPSGGRGAEATPRS